MAHKRSCTKVLQDTSQPEELHDDSQKKPFSCSHCGKSFSSKSNYLKNHLVLHTGEKKYKCVQCERTFSQSGHLRTHMMTHTGEKRYSCVQCLKSFSRGSSLKKHTMIHTGEEKK